jgi:serine/threonine-protein kinase HipA
VQTEAECLTLARTIGLTKVDAQIEQIADVTCLLVSRFDRRVRPDGSVERIHQEDACQALGRNPGANRGRGKYQDAGGPSLREIAGLLDRYAVNPRGQLDTLLAATTFTVLIGNADAHGKNLGLLHPTGETIELAPLYDTVPTALWPKLRSRGAMSINDRWELGSITGDDLVHEATSWRHDQRRAQRVVRRTAEQMLDAIDAIDPGSPVSQLVAVRAGRLLADFAEGSALADLPPASIGSSPSKGTAANAPPRSSPSAPA